MPSRLKGRLNSSIVLLSGHSKARSASLQLVAHHGGRLGGSLLGGRGALRLCAVATKPLGARLRLVRLLRNAEAPRSRLREEGGGSHR